MIFADGILLNRRRKGGATNNEHSGWRRIEKTSPLTSRMNSARHSQGNHPLDSRPFRRAWYTRERTSGTGPKGRYDSHDATTNGSPIVGWLLIRYLVLPLSNSPYTPRARTRARQPTITITTTPILSSASAASRCLLCAPRPIATETVNSRANVRATPRANIAMDSDTWHKSARAFTVFLHLRKIRTNSLIDMMNFVHSEDDNI